MRKPPSTFCCSCAWLCNYRKEINGIYIYFQDHDPEADSLKGQQIVTVYVSVPDGKGAHDIVLTYEGITRYNPCGTETTNTKVNWDCSQPVQQFGLMPILEDSASEFDPAFVLPSLRRAIQGNGRSPVLHRVSPSRSRLKRFFAHIVLSRLHTS